MNFRGEYLALEQRRKEALARQDAVAYHKLCNAAGIQDIEDEALFMMGQAEVRGKVDVEKRVGNNGFGKKRRRIDYDRFGQEIRGYEDLQPYNIMHGISDKRQILISSGRNALRVASGESVATAVAEEDRVGMAFRRTYNDYHRWKAKQNK